MTIEQADLVTGEAYLTVEKADLVTGEAYLTIEQADLVTCLRLSFLVRQRAFAFLCKGLSRSQSRQSALAAVRSKGFSVGPVIWESDRFPDVSPVTGCRRWEGARYRKEVWNQVSVRVIGSRSYPGKNWASPKKFPQSTQPRDCPHKYWNCLNGFDIKTQNLKLYHSPQFPIPHTGDKHGNSRSHLDLLPEAQADRAQ